jgi:hypothetical protein
LKVVPFLDFEEIVILVEPGFQEENHWQGDADSYDSSDDDCH